MSNKVTPTNQQNQNRTTSVMVRESLFSGPLPPAEELQKYNDVLPGAADRIMKMAEEQSEHRRELEKSVVNAGNKKSSLGLILGFIIILVIALSGTFLLYLGKDIAGYAALIGSLATLIIGYLKNVNKHSRDLEKRNK